MDFRNIVFLVYVATSTFPHLCWSQASTSCISFTCPEPPLTVLTAGPFAAQSPCCQRVIPPIKLLDTGSQVVEINAATSQRLWANATCADGEARMECITPPMPYTEYVNAYIDNYRFGIPILATSVLDESMRLARGIVIQLLNQTSRIIPDVSEVLSQAYVRIVITPCGDSSRNELIWNIHPEANVNSTVRSLGGGSRDFPTIGAIENNLPVQALATDGCYHERYPVLTEEIFHTIHAIAIQELDQDAFDAIVCLATRDTADATFAVSTPVPATEEARLAEVHTQFGSDWRDTVSYEYFVAAIATWAGTPIMPLIRLPGGNVTRAALKIHKPDLACLIARYFPDVGEPGGDQCPSNIPEPMEAPCTTYPGSCHCLGTLTAEYMGPAIDRSKCPSLRSIKEGSGYMDRTLPFNADNVRCDGCRVPGCELDRGQDRDELARAIAKSQESSAAAIYTICRSALVLSFLMVWMFH